MSQSRPSSVPRFLRKFAITDTVRHEKGHTVYKVVCQDICIATSEINSEIVVWKRYNDFKKLHLALLNVHRSLYLKGTFPPFARGKFFGRFENEIINERKASALQLLEFANSNHVLVSSAEFTAFFEEGTKEFFKTSKSDRHFTISSMKNSNVAPSCDNSSTQHDLLGDIGEAGLGGIWNHRKPLDVISLNSNEEISDDETIFSDSDSTFSQTRLSLDLSGFDPLLDVPDEQKTCPKSSEMFNFPDVLTDIMKAEQKSQNTNVSEFDPFFTKGEDVMDSSDSTLQPLSPLTPTIGCATSEIQQYLFEAASVMSLAQQYEANLNYQKAFEYYKIGIDKLLSGVQKETHESRRDAVRKKISNYLQKVDDIYSLHIAKDSVADKIWTNVNQKFEADSRGSSTELKQYKVLGIIDKVMLVLDSITKESYIMKVLCKTSSSTSSLLQSIVPKDIPFMTKLYKVFETNYALYLVLEHASGGRLWSYVSQFIQTSPCSPSQELQCPTRKLISPAKESSEKNTDGENVYSGKQLMDKKIANETKPPLNDDLCAEPDYSESYVELFLNAPSCNEPEQPSIEARKVVDEVEEVGTPMLETSEADDLISNARRLLVNVDETIERSRSEVNLTPEELPVAIEHSSPGPPKPRSLSFGSCGQNRRRPSVKLHEPFSSPATTPIRRKSSSYKGSLENLSTHHVVRGVSTIFEQFDEINQYVAVFLPEKCVKSWAAEIAVAISNLHMMGIVCKDLKPENILLGDGGHIKLTYFSQWNFIEYQIDEDARDNLYCAPELNGVLTVTKSVDWWSFGVLLFELLIGRTLVSCHPGGITSHTQLFLPNHLSEEAKLILRQLLTANPIERLRFEDIKSHPFFSNVDWSKII